MFATQAVVEVSTIIIFLLSAVLAVYLTRNYLRIKARSLIFWSAGLWLFALGVILEILFAFGIYSEFLIATYLFVVALLVNSLALGSMELLKSRKLKWPYYIFSIAAETALLYSLVVSNIGNIISTYVVWGILPLLVVTMSSIITFVAAIILVVIAVMTYLRTKNKKMLSIIAGVIIVSVAGSLYIVQFPAFLYYSEFIGIVLLWFGFFSFKSSKQKASANKSSR